MRRALLIAPLALAALLLAPLPALAARQVSYPVLLRQVESGPLIRAIINRRRSAIEIKFRDLSEWEAFYPPGAQPTLQRILHRRHVRVIFASRHHAKVKNAAVHHHLRYIAAGAIGALVLIGAALLLYSRGRARTPARPQAPAA